MFNVLNKELSNTIACFENIGRILQALHAQINNDVEKMSPAMTALWMFNKNNETLIRNKS